MGGWLGFGMAHKGGPQEQKMGLGRVNQQKQNYTQLLAPEPQCPECP